ncbi:SWIM zinc finger family protein [Polymorphospora sp. NPDC050346]|uniref:SWIM zinc finger family protein n=1 Tax=Polymorphospora sp. NPDC050346 TaxID=3155780 RepID=UPI0033CE6AF6
MSGDRVRGFPAFGRGGRRVRQFAASWWGRAWVRAMEETALDAEQLRKGRRYAYTGHVGSITVSPGRLAAPVYGDDGATYTTVVHVERLADAGWERLADEVAGSAGYLAALLDGEVPHDLVAAAGDAGVRLLPDLGDLQPECDCADFEFPCRHAAALCYQASWLLDADPFVLLLLRGRGRGELLAGLRRRGAAGSPATAPPEPAADGPVGVDAVAAYAGGLPALPVPPPTVAADPAGGVVFPAAPGVDPEILRRAVTAAAGRAAALRARR